MENNVQETDSVEINIMDLVQVLLSKSIIIILVAFICAVAVFVYENLFVTLQYTSETKMLVLARQNSDTISSGDITTSTSLTQDYMELIKTREVTEKAISALGLTVGGKPMTHEQLLDKINVSQTTSTRIITISVDDPDPAVAQSIANTVRELGAEHIKSVVNTEAVNVADYANLPTAPSSPHKTRDSVIGAAVGFILACAVILIMYMADNTINSSDDVERYLGLSTLGTIQKLEETKKRSGGR